MRLLRLPLLLVLMLALAAFVACNDDEEEAATATPTKTATAAAGTPTAAATATATATAAATATQAPTPAAGAASTVAVVLSEFKVEPDPATAAPGTVTFEATNEGAVPHELMVIKTDLAADALPVEGGAVDEGAAGLEVIGEIEEFPAGEKKSGEFELEAGKYVLICNVPGHYGGGMRVAFTVE